MAETSFTRGDREFYATVESHANDAGVIHHQVAVQDLAGGAARRYHLGAEETAALLERQPELATMVEAWRTENPDARVAAPGPSESQLSAKIDALNAKIDALTPPKAEEAPPPAPSTWGQ